MLDLTKVSLGELLSSSDQTITTHAMHILEHLLRKHPVPPKAMLNDPQYQQHYFTQRLEET